MDQSGSISPTRAASQHPNSISVLSKTVNTDKNLLRFTMLQKRASNPYGDHFVKPADFIKKNSTATRTHQGLQEFHRQQDVSMNSTIQSDKLSLPQIIAFNAERLHMKNLTIVDRLKSRSTVDIKLYRKPHEVQQPRR